MSTEQQLREDLAAAFRLAAHYDLHEAIANHFSVTLDDTAETFLIQPSGKHFSEVYPDDLLKLKTGAPAPLDQPGAPDPTAWVIHTQLHQHVPHARCVMHTHSPWALSLCCLEDFEFLMLDQNACLFYNEVAYDHDLQGMALDQAEGERLAGLAQDGKRVLMLANHGIIILGDTVAQAFDRLYFFERACRVQVLAHSTGKPLRVIPDALAAKTHEQWLDYPSHSPFHEQHFDAQKRVLAHQS